MASVSMDGKGSKCDLGKALYGIPKHNYRTGKNHSNKDIDASRSHLNKHYGPQTVEEFRERLRAMIAECDRKHPPKRKKQDRKVMLDISIPSPREGMSAEDEARWSKATAEVIYEMFGDYVVGGTYHADEVHWYTPPDETEQHLSRGHTHWNILPWTDARGLNMDEFYKRDLPNKINAALDVKCMEMFGIPFRDGSKKKSRGKVEKMKLESTIAERVQKENVVKEMDEIINMNAQVIKQQGKQITDQEKAIKANNDSLSVLDAKMKRKQYIVDKLTADVKKQLNEAFNALVEPMLTKLDNCRKGLNKPWLSKEQQAYAGELLEDAASTIRKKIPEWGNDMLQNRSDKVAREVGKATEYFRQMRAAEQGNGNMDDMDYMDLE